MKTAPENLAARRYVIGIGWCWILDDEIIEIVQTEEESNEG